MSILTVVTSLENAGKVVGEVVDEERKRVSVGHSFWDVRIHGPCVSVTRSGQPNPGS